MKIVKRVRRGYVVNIFAQIILVFKKVLYLPLFLHFLGEDVYGEWLILFSAVGNMAIISIGWDTYIINKLLFLRNQGKYDEYNKILSTCINSLLIIASVVMGLFVLVVTKIGLNDFLNINIIAEQTSGITAIILAIYILSSVILKFIHKLYNTFDEYSRRRIFLNVEEILQIICVALALILSRSVVHIAIAYLVPLVVVSTVMVIDLKRRYSWVRYLKFGLNIGIISNFIFPSFLFMIIEISNLVRQQLPVLMVGKFLSPAVVTIFVAHRTLVYFSQTLINSLHSVAWPELSKLFSLNEFSKLRAAILLLTKISFWAVSMFVLVLAFSGNVIMEKWTSGNIAMHQGLFNIFAATVLLRSIWQTSALFLSSTNNHQLLAICSSISLLAGLLISYLLLSLNYGLNGFVVGLLVPELILCFTIIPIRANKLLSLNLKKYYFEILMKSTFYLSTLSLVVYVINLLSFSSYTHVFVVGSMTLTFGLIIGYFLLLQSDERQYVKELIGFSKT